MLWGQLRSVLQRLWLVLVLAGGSYYLTSRWTEIVDVLRGFPLSVAAFAFAAIIVSKGFLTWFVCAVAQGQSLNLTWKQGAFAYNTSQIAKYAPGSVWQFLSRAGIYRILGFTGEQIGRVILVELVWLVGSASLVGLPAFVLHGTTLLDRAGLTVIGRWSLLVGGVVTAIAVVLAFRGTFARVLALAKPTTRYVLSLGGAWIFLGLSFWLLIASQTDATPLYIVSLFALAYAIGTIAVFAPAGIGVREAVLAVGLAQQIGVGDALIAAAVHRILYLLADISLGTIVYVLISGTGNWRLRGA